MLELVFSLIAVAVTLTGAGWLLKAGWDQGKCAYIVFEQTHARVTHSSPLPLSGAYQGSVQIAVSNDQVDGSAECGATTEQVSLPQLDPEAE